MSASAASSASVGGAVELERQRVLGARELALVAHEVDRQLDRARLGVHPALDRLADPPRRVGREAVALAPVELLDRADQAEDALLDQVEQRQLGALVLLRDRDDEAQVRVDHAVLGGEVAALDPLREVDLLRRREQPVAADLVEEELQRVGRRRRELGVVERRCSSLAPAVVAQLDPAAVELLVERPRSASSSSSACTSSSTSESGMQPSCSPRSISAATGPSVASSLRSGPYRDCPHRIGRPVNARAARRLPASGCAGTRS